MNTHAQTSITAVPCVGNIYQCVASGKYCDIVACDPGEVTIRWLDTAHVAEQTIADEKFTRDFVIRAPLPLDDPSLPAFFQQQAD